MEKKLCWFAGILLLAIVFVFANFSFAAEYPTKNIIVLAPFGASANSAVALKIVGDAASKTLGQPVLVEASPGAGGMLAGTRVFRAKPDGYTLLGANAATNIVSTYFFKDSTYKYSDFQYLAQFGAFNIGLAVKPNSPFKVFEDYLEYVKKNPSAIIQGASGSVGSSVDLCLQLLQIKGGLPKINVVPFNNAFEVRTALTGGHIDAALIYGGAGGESDEFNMVLKSGGKILAVATKTRLKDYPDVPTFTEKGLDVVFSTWWGFAGPKDMPEVVSKKLKNALYTALNDPQVIKRIEALGFTFEFRNSEEFTSFVKEVDKIVKAIFEKTKIQ